MGNAPCSAVWCDLLETMARWVAELGAVLVKLKTIMPTPQNALRLLKKSRKPMALVRNSAGRIFGMITLEDVIEEIVGDIEDEHDRPMRKVRVRRRVVARKPELKK